MRLAWLVALGALLSACAQEPTAFDIPTSATSVERFPILGGNAFQTEFTLEATYPRTPALEFYRDHFGTDWLLCEWSGSEWQSFIDAQGDIPLFVHQQLYMLVNRKAQREIMLSMRYISEQNGSLPDSNIQHIVIVEYMNSDSSETIKRLELRCPSG